MDSSNNTLLFVCLPLANIESFPVWGISCIINEIRILQRAISSDQSKLNSCVWRVILRMHSTFYICKLTREGGWNFEVLLALVTAKYVNLINYAGNLPNRWQFNNRLPLVALKKHWCRPIRVCYFYLTTTMVWSLHQSTLDRPQPKCCIAYFQLHFI